MRYRCEQAAERRKPYDQRAKLVILKEKNLPLWLNVSYEKVKFVGDGQQKLRDHSTE